MALVVTLRFMCLTNLSLQFIANGVWVLVPMVRLLPIYPGMLPFWVAIFLLPFERRQGETLGSPDLVPLWHQVAREPHGWGRDHS